MVFRMDAAAWQRIFQHLSIQDIFSCCQVCTTSASAAHAFVCRRQADAAEAKEGYLVPYENRVDNEPYADIGYVSENVLSTGVKVREAYGPLTTERCDCIGSAEDAWEVQTESVRERRHQLCREYSPEDNQASFQVCNLGLCSCGTDLQNEAAYDDEGRLLALLAPQLNLVSPEATQYDGSEFPPRLHLPSPESGLRLESFEDIKSNEVIEEPSSSCPLNMEPLPKKRKRHLEKEHASSKKPADTPSIARGQPTIETSSGAFQKTRKSVEESELRIIRESEHEQINHNEPGLDSMTSSNESLVVFECGPGCQCGMECGNRLTQRGLAAKVKVVRHRQKGWCLHAAEDIRRGAFICQYAGEYFDSHFSFFLVV